jgi:hypothetical protein
MATSVAETKHVGGLLRILYNVRYSYKYFYAFVDFISVSQKSQVFAFCETDLLINDT